MVKRAGGWTLMEVLVVVAIILVLAALMYAIGVFAVDRAHQARCISNLRQIGIALLQYMEDYKRGDWETEIDSYVGIEDRLERQQLVARWGFPRDLYHLYEGGYLKDRRLLECPRYNLKVQFRVHYGYNNPATLVRLPPYFLGRVNTWEDFLWVLQQRKGDYPIAGDSYHNSESASGLDDKILHLILRLDGRVDRRMVTRSDLTSLAHLENL